MKVEIKSAILALAQVDDTMSVDERMELAKFLSGEKREKVIKRKEVAKILECHPNTIDKMIRNGTLVAVKGADGHVRGVTEASLARYTEGKAVA